MVKYCFFLLWTFYSIISIIPMSNIELLGSISMFWGRGGGREVGGKIHCDHFSIQNISLFSYFFPISSFFILLSTHSLPLSLYLILSLSISVTFSPTFFLSLSFSLSPFLSFCPPLLSVSLPLSLSLSLLSWRMLNTMERDLSLFPWNWE